MIGDSAIALRVIYLLTLSFKDWPAFHEGIIDEDGKFLRPNKSSSNWTMLHRLVARLKILLGKLPGGQTKIASYIAAYMLVKENLDIDDETLITEEDLTNYKVSFKNYLEFKSLIEDGEVANTVANVAGMSPTLSDPNDEPGARKRKKKNEPTLNKNILTR